MAVTRRCHYCSKILRDGDQTKDHIVPKAWGGLNEKWNLVWSCRKCNREKSAYMPNCKCTQCFTAVMRWHNGQRAEVTRYVDAEVWTGPTPEPQFCMVACKNHGCPYPECKWPERLDPARA